MSTSLRPAVLQRARAGLARSQHLIARCWDSCRTWEEAGVIATAVTDRPEHPHLNSVIGDATLVVPRLPRLRRWYASLGVTRWTLWVHSDEDPAVAGALLADGFTEHEALGGMWRPARGRSAGEQAAGASSVSRDEHVAEVLALNDEVYGHGMSSHDVRPPVVPPGLRSYAWVEGGRVVAGVLACDVADTCWTGFLATRATHRGRGIATRLMSEALGDSETRGASMFVGESSLQARTIHLSLGWQELGAWRPFCCDGVAAGRPPQ